MFPKFIFQFDYTWNGWLLLLHNFIQRSLNSRFTQIQILLVTCQSFPTGVDIVSVLVPIRSTGNKNKRLLLVKLSIKTIHHQINYYNTIVFQYTIIVQYCSILLQLLLQFHAITKFNRHITRNCYVWYVTLVGTADKYQAVFFSRFSKENVSIKYFLRRCVIVMQLPYNKVL